MRRLIQAVMLIGLLAAGSPGCDWKNFGPTITAVGEIIELVDGMLDRDDGRSSGNQEERNLKIACPYQAIVTRINTLLETEDAIVCQTLFIELRRCIEALCSTASSSEAESLRTDLRKLADEIRKQNCQ